MGSDAMEKPGAKPVKGGKLGLLDVVALSLWMGGMHFAAILIFLALFNLPSLWAITLLVTLITLTVIPLFDDCAFGHALARFVYGRAVKYFPVTVIYEDEKALRAASPCVLALEPHSILPVGTIGLNQNGPSPPFQQLRLGASSTILNVPILRHLWTWLGIASASKKELKRLLSRGVTVGVVPGGVQECLFFERGIETIFLKKRKGFVRLAMEEKVPLVPVFIFGQSDVFHWWKPSGKWYNNLSRSLGFAPLLFWGVWGSFIPFPVPMTVVVGKPMAVPPPDENGNLKADQVDALHQKYISEMERLFSTYKTEAGYESRTLRIL